MHREGNCKGKGEYRVDSYLRRATKDDKELLFVWANEPLVRKNSFTTKIITKEEHEEWFQCLLESKDCCQYIYMCGDEAVGQIRIKINGNMAKISYSICKEKRGQGYSGDILRLIHRQVRLDFPSVKTLLGEVKTDNMASRKAFLTAGFKEKYLVYEIPIGNCEERDSIENELQQKGSHILNL